MMSKSRGGGAEQDERADPEALEGAEDVGVSNDRGVAELDAGGDGRGPERRDCQHRHEQQPAREGGRPDPFGTGRSVPQTLPQDAEEDEEGDRGEREHDRPDDDHPAVVAVGVIPEPLEVRLVPLRRVRDEQESDDEQHREDDRRDSTRSQPAACAPVPTLLPCPCPSLGRSPQPRRPESSTPTPARPQGLRAERVEHLGEPIDAAPARRVVALVVDAGTDELEVEAALVARGQHLRRGCVRGGCRRRRGRAGSASRASRPRSR